MEMLITNATVSRFSAIFCLLISGCTAQQPYPYYKPVVNNAAYTVPTVLVDATHHNRHQSTGSFAPFAELLRADGYRVADFDTDFSTDCLATINTTGCEYWDSLQEAEVLVIAHPYDDINQDEALVIALWVHEGGSLLLVTDHAPFIENSQELLKQLNLAPSSLTELHDGSHDRGSEPWDDTHPVILGRYSSENITYISSGTSDATGLVVDNQSLFTGDMPEPSLIISNNNGVGHTAALEWGAQGGRVIVVADGRPLTDQSLLFSLANATMHSCDDMWSIRQCLVYFAETTCVAGGIAIEDCEAQLGHFGLPDGDNTQFVLNILHWLDGLI